MLKRGLVMSDQGGPRVPIVHIFLPVHGSDEIEVGETGTTCQPEIAKDAAATDGQPVDVVLVGLQELERREKSVVEHQRGPDLASEGV